MVASHCAGVIDVFVLAHRRHQALRLGAQASLISAAPVEAADYLAVSPRSSCSPKGVIKLLVLTHRRYQASQLGPLYQLVKQTIASSRMYA